MKTAVWIQQRLTEVARLAIFTNIFIAAGAVAFAMTNARMLGFEISRLWILWLHIGSATLLVYQLSRWSFHRRTLTAPRVDAIYRWLENNRAFTIGSMLISAACMGISFLLLQKESRWALVALGAIAVLYPLEVPVGKGKSLRLRDIPFAKIFLIALVWAGMAVILPLTELLGWKGLRVNELILLLLQALYILIITLPFDINDRQIDRITGVLTIPNVLGTLKSKYLVTALSVWYLLAMALWLPQSNLLFLVGLTVLLSALNYMTWRYSSGVSKWRIMLWYDGSFFWYWLLVMIFFHGK